MKPLEFKEGDTVWISYDASPGHGPSIKGPGRVEHITAEVHKSMTGREYKWVTVKPAGFLHAVVLASYFLHVQDMRKVMRVARNSIERVR